MKKSDISQVKFDYDDITDMMYVTLARHNHESSNTFYPITLSYKGIGDIPASNNIKIMLDMENAKLLGVVVLRYSKTKDIFVKAIMQQILGNSSNCQKTIDDIFEKFLYKFAMGISEVSQKIEGKHLIMKSVDSGQAKSSQRNLERLIAEINEIGRKSINRELVKT